MRRFLSAIAFVAIASYLTGCGDIPEQRARVEVRAAEQTTPTTVDRVAVRKLRAQIVWQDTILFNAVVALHAAAELNAVAVNITGKSRPGRVTSSSCHRPAPCDERWQLLGHGGAVLR